MHPKNSSYAMRIFITESALILRSVFVDMDNDIGMI